MAAAAAINAALEMANVLVPSVITLIKTIKKKDGTTVTSVTILAKLDEADADFASNVKADTDWFAAHGIPVPGQPAAGGTESKG